MAVLNKLSKPSLAKGLEPFDGDLIYVLNDEKEIYDSLIENITIDYAEVERAEFNGCHFKNVTFNECNFEGIDIIDVVFENCDLSNVNFSGGSIHKAEFRNCKLLGSNFTDCNIQNVLFVDSIGRYSNFSISKMKLVNLWVRLLIHL